MKNNQKPKFTNKLYYRLSEAAEYLTKNKVEGSEDSLLQLASIGEVELIVRAIAGKDFDILTVDQSSSSFTEHTDVQSYMARIWFIRLNPSRCLSLSVHGHAEVDSFKVGYGLSEGLGLLYELTPLDFIMDSGDFDDFDYDAECAGFFRFKYADNFVQTINVNDVFIRANEVDRLITDDPTHELDEATPETQPAQVKSVWKDKAQNRADELSRDNPTWPKKTIARQIEKEFKEQGVFDDRSKKSPAYETIYKNIKIKTARRK